MYQDDYPNLLNAVEVGMKITYNPGGIGSYLTEFTNSVNQMYNEVRPVWFSGLGVISYYR